MKNSITAIILLFTAIAVHAQEQKGPKTVHYEKADVIFPGDRSRQDTFYKKLDSLIAKQISNLNIWQVGGSHIQGGTFPYRLMDKFQTLAGQGERGFLFPRDLAGTHPDRTYRMTARGEWTAPMITRAYEDEEKPKYGITGFSAVCDSAAQIGLNIDPKNKGQWHFNKVRVLGYGSSDKAYPEVIVGSKTVKYKVDTTHNSYVFELPVKTDSIIVNFVVPEGEQFVFMGLQPLTGNKGINFFTSGVNGASVPTWGRYCSELEHDLRLVKPDLVIFGLGINDSACPADKFSPERFKSNYRQLIRKIQAVSPECAMIFITNNDSYRYVRGGMEPNANAEAVRKAMVELALEYGAGVWDLYGMMGGKESVEVWKSGKLVGNDRLHFTYKGYRLLGDLLYEAIIRDWKNTKK